MKTVFNKWKLLMLVVMITLPGLAISQPPFDDDDQDVPFDGGVSLLVAAGIGYGLKKAYDRKKEEKNSEVIEK